MNINTDEQDASTVVDHKYVRTDACKALAGTAVVCSFAFMVANAMHAKSAEEFLSVHMGANSLSVKTVAGLRSVAIIAFERCVKTVVDHRYVFTVDKIPAALNAEALKSVLTSVAEVVVENAVVR